MLFLLSLVFTAHIWGKGTPVAAFAGIGLWGVWHLYKSRTLTTQLAALVKSPYTPVISGVLFIWLLSACLGINAEKALRGWASAAALVVLSGMAYVNMQRFSIRDYSRFCKWVAILSVAGCLLFLLAYSEVCPALNMSLSEDSQGERPQLRAYASILAMALPFVWLYGLKEKSIGMAVAALMLAVIVLTEGRSGWMASIAALVIFSLFYPWRRATLSLKNKLLFIAHVPFGVSVGYWVMHTTIASEKLAERLTISAGGGTGESRVEIWQFALENIAHSPWFGIGIKGFRYLDFGDIQLASTMHPHNIFIEMAIETGILGVLAFCGALSALLLPVLWRLWRSKKPQAAGIQAAAVAALAAYLTSALLLTAFFHLWWMTYFAVLVTLVVAIDRGLIKGRP